MTKLLATHKTKKKEYAQNRYYLKNGKQRQKNIIKIIKKVAKTNAN